MTSNDHTPSVEPPQSPALFYSDPELLLQDVEAAITRCRHAQDVLAADVRPEDATFDNVIVPLLHSENALSSISLFSKFLKDVSTDKGLRDSSREAGRMLNKFDIESGLRRDIFALIDAVVRKNESLDGECRYALEKIHRAFIKHGVAISDASERSRFEHIQNRISELATGCNKNFADERGGLWLTPHDLEGLPEDALSNLKRGEGENQGKVWLTMKPSDHTVAMKYVKNADIRKTILIAFENKCSNNVPLLREIFVLRDEVARLLGYSNNAALKIEDRMAKSSRVVEDFLHDLQQRLTPAAQAVIQEETRIKSAELKSRGLEASDDKKLYLWDTAYYGRLMKEQQCSLDQKKLSEYYPLGEVLRGMLANFEHLFGVRVVDITTKAAGLSAVGRSGLWHEDVKAFELWDDDDEGGSFLGYLYLDLHPRDFKRSHPTHINLQPVGFLSLVLFPYS